MKRPVVWLLVLGLAFVLLVGASVAAWYFLAGQGLNLAQLRQKYGPDYEAKRQQLKKVAGLLPPPGTVQGKMPAKDFDPAPTYDLKAQRYNVEIAMFEQLLDPDVDLVAKKEVDLILFEAGLVQNMRILGPKSVTSPDIRSTGKSLAQFDEALRLPYLVVVRPVLFVRPVAVGQDKYTPGVADLEVFVVDLRTEKIRASGRIQARSAESTTAFVRKNDDKAQSIESAAYSTLYTDARRKLAELLREITGGTFVLER